MATAVHIYMVVCAQKPLAGIFVAAAVYIYMVGAQKPLASIFEAAAVNIYMVDAQKPPEIRNTIHHDKVIISSYL